jgi:hypothetical protein
MVKGFMPEVQAATIAATNYWPHVRVLADSLARHDPGAVVHALMVDLAIGQPLEGVGPNLVVHRLPELGLPALATFAPRFSLTEFCTAVKPAFLRRLLNTSGAGRVLYLDPDLMFFDSLRFVWERLGPSDILLTPHFLDAGEPADVEQEMLYLRVGTFNLGFIGLADTPNVRRFLDWWEQRCWRFNCDDPERGVFTDQQWVNLAPGMFRKVEILEHAGLNVNFHSVRVRRPRPDGDGFRLAGGEPLVFFHFHKFRPGQSPTAYFHGNLDTTAAAALHGRYAAALAGQRGPAPNTPPFDRLADGSPYPAVFRRAYREMLARPDARPVTEAVAPDDMGRRVIADSTSGPYVRVWAFHECRGGRGTPGELLAAYRRSRRLRRRIDGWFYLFGPSAVPFPIHWVDTTRGRRLLRRMVGVCWRGLRSALDTLRGPRARPQAVPSIAPLRVPTAVIES